MKKSRFTESQVVAILKEGEAGMAVSDAKQLKELETENARLKKLLAESVLENEVARVTAKKVSPRIDLRSTRGV